MVEWTWTIAMVAATVASGWLMRQGQRDMQAAAANAALVGNARRGIFAAMLTRHAAQTFAPASLLVVAGAWALLTPNPEDIAASRYVTNIVITALGALWSFGVLLDVVDRRRIRKYRERLADAHGSEV